MLLIPKPAIASTSERAPSRLSASIARVATHPWLALVWVGMTAWTALFIARARAHYDGFLYSRFDLGNMVQAVWSTAQGRPLETTLGNGQQVERLASHVDPILVLLTPLWLAFPSPLTLAAAQVLACALGALPVFWLARRHLGSEKLGALLALTYLAYPWVAWSALEAIHPVTFAIPLFLFAIWFLDSERLVPFSICAVLAASTGELMGLPLAGLGLWYWIDRGHRRAGLLIAGLGVTWTLVAVKLIVPAFRGEDSQFYALFNHIGGTPEGVLQTAVTDPLLIVEALATQRDLIFLLLLAAPLGWFFFRTPTLAVAALPILAVNLLSSMTAHTNPRHHTIGGIVPFLIAASVFGLARCEPVHRPRVSAVVTAVALGCFVILGPVFRPPEEPWKGAHVEALRAAVALVPADGAVVATNRAGSYLSARQYVYSVPTLGRAEWAVVDRRDTWVPIRPSDGAVRYWGVHDRRVVTAFTARLDKRPDWRKIFDRDDVVVYRKTTAERTSTP